MNWLVWDFTRYLVENYDVAFEMLTAFLPFWRSRLRIHAHLSFILHEGFRYFSQNLGVYFKLGHDRLLPRHVQDIIYS